MKVVIIVAIVLVANYLIMDIIGAVLMFRLTMYRNPHKPRTRDCTEKNNPAKQRMFDQGLAWSKHHSDLTQPVHIVSDGLNLYGEYVDFGNDKCAIILQGRTESLIYSYYYADVYARNGYNILVVDIRAHGLSDGTYHSSGILESEDLIAWIEYLRTSLGISDVTLHGVCVGGATAIYAYHKLQAKGVQAIRSIVTDGLFSSNYEMFRRNMKDYRQPAFPALQLCFLLARLFVKVNLFKESPNRYMPSIGIPFLFIYSREDKYAVPSKGQQLYDSCASPKKELRFFPKGAHSHVRYNQPLEYDNVIAKFLAQEVQ